jgi:hypothetical protein
MNEAQRAIVSEALGRTSLGVPQPIDPDSQKIRTGLQGMTFGFSDEVEALIRSSLPNGPEYEVVRDEIRQKLRDYQQANLGEAISLEIAGALIPSILASITGFGAPVAATRLASIPRIAGVSAAEGAVSAAGYSESDLFSGEGARDVATGTGSGTAFGTGAQLLTGQLGRLGTKLLEFTRKKLGGADSAVQAELLRLQKATGLTIDEIIADVASGRIIADNATLSNAIKGMVNEGGEAASLILDASKARRSATTQQAQESLRGALSPDVDDPNILRARAATEADLQKQQSEAYKGIFQSAQTVSKDVADQMLNIISRMPAARAKLKELYDARPTLVPLFKENADGSITFVRAPTLEDAEIIRRQMSEEASGRFRASEGAMGQAVTDLERPLRKAIDVESPELGATRAQYSQMLTQNEAFDLGKRQALTMNVDDLEIEIERLQSNPEALSAFRAGAMAALENRARRGGTTLEKLAQEDVQLGAALRVLLPPDQAETVLRDVTRAAEATSMDKYIQKRAGSPTQPLQREQQLRGSGTSMEDLVRGAQGDPFAIIKTMVNSVPSAQGLNDKQLSEVAKVLYSQDPDMVRRALTDQTFAGELLRRAEQLASGFAQFSRTAGAQQGAQLGVEN